MALSIDYLVQGMNYGLVLVGFVLAMLLTAFALAFIGSIIWIAMTASGIVDDGGDDEDGEAEE